MATLLTKTLRYFNANDKPEGTTSQSDVNSPTESPISGVANAGTSNTRTEDIDVAEDVPDSGEIPERNHEPARFPKENHERLLSQKGTVSPLKARICAETNI